MRRILPTMTTSSATLEDVTAKKRLLREAPGWSEREAEVALSAVEEKRIGEDGGKIADEWGELSETTEAAAAETMKRLTQEEQAAGQEPW